MLHLLCFMCVIKEELEDTKGIIRIRKKKNRQRNGQKKRDKQRSTKHTHKTKDRVTRTPPKTGGEFRCSGSVGSSCLLILIVVYLYQFKIEPYFWNGACFSNTLCTNKKFKDAEMVIKSRKSKDRQCNNQKKNNTKIQTIDKILHRN